MINLGKYKFPQDESVTIMRKQKEKNLSGQKLKHVGSVEETNKVSLVFLKCQEQGHQMLTRDSCNTTQNSQVSLIKPCCFIGQCDSETFQISDEENYY